MFHVVSPKPLPHPRRRAARGTVLEFSGSVLTAVLSLSLVAGVLLGLLGGGGSILMVPVFTLVAALSPEEAIASSLCVVAIASMVAALGHALAGRVDVRVGLVFGTAGMAGAFAGSKLSTLVPGNVLLLAFAVMMIATGIAMLRPRRVAGPETRQLVIPRVIMQGLAVGTITGFVGAGGGFLVVPTLVLFGGVAIERAIGTSLLVIALQSSAGFVGHLGHVDLDGRMLAAVTAVAALGSIAGFVMSRHVAPATLRRGFGVFVLVMAAVVVARVLLG